MQTTLPMESSLLLVIHEAEAAVRRYRVLHDLAAQVGVPAHITVAYPFKPTGAMGESDLARLGKLIAATPAFNIELASTGWFNTDVLFLTPRTPTRSSGSPAGWSPLSPTTRFTAAPTARSTPT